LTQPKRRSHSAGAPPGVTIRQTAHRVILDVIERHRPFDESFEGRASGLGPRDRAFMRRLTMTTLRRFGQTEALITSLLDRGPLPSKQVGLRALLAMAASELIFLGTPPHAAIDTAVRLAQATPQLASQSGLVNALLRRLSREVKDEETAQARAPVTLNAPSWLMRRWEHHYGKDIAQAFALAHVQEPPLDFTVKGDAAGWAKKLDAALLPTGSLRRTTGGLIGDLPGYHEGAWWVQDAAAALPARLLGDVAGQSVLDLCAAPGGKTAQLAASGAKVTALDRDAGRLARLEANLKRLGLGAQFVCADVAAFRPDSPASHILLDAPCSATGTLRRHPDLPWLKRETDIAQSVAQQAQLLDAAITMLAPGGVLVYAVCSLEPEESEAQIASLLARNNMVRPVPLKQDEVPGTATFITKDGFLRTTPAHWPEHGGLDGFFAARLVRA
jgi:16S rRNA (cytosine967-C5)-methyltransferase